MLQDSGPEQATRARRALQQQYRYPGAFSYKRITAACIAGSEDQDWHVHDEEPVKHLPFTANADVILRWITYFLVSRTG